MLISIETHRTWGGGGAKYLFTGIQNVKGK